MTRAGGLLLLGALGVAAWGASLQPAGRPAPFNRPAAAALAQAPVAVCVAASRFCVAPAAPDGEPCSCPHPMRGRMPGRTYSVETLLAEPWLLPRAPYQADGDGEEEEGEP